MPSIATLWSIERQQHRWYGVADLFADDISSAGGSSRRFNRRSGVGDK